MPVSLHDPMIQSSLLPLALSLILTGLLRGVLGPGLGGRCANLSVLISFFVLAGLIQGVIFPPVGSTHKIPYLLGALALIALVADMIPLRGRALGGVLLVVPALALGWLNQTRWSGADGVLLLKVGGLYSLTLLALWRLGRQRRKGLDGVLVLLFASAGFAAISLMGASALLTTQAFALTAALGGFALWNWPRYRFPAGAGILLTGVGLMLLVNQALLLTDTSVFALVLLLPLFFVDSLAAPLIRRWGSGETTRPLLIGSFCLVLTLIAVGVSFSINPISADMGY